MWNDLHFYSPTLGIQTAAYVLLPELAILEKHAGEPIPALYLLHGLSDDHTAWLCKTRLTEYARKKYVAIVMPAANRSFYMDMAFGAKYWSFISDELPRLMEATFPLSRTREGRFAAGLSMGGYGAMKLGLCCPQRYAAIAALSAPLMMQEAFGVNMPDAAWIHEMEGIYGSEKALRDGDGNLVRLAEMLAPAVAPRMFAACGTADFLWKANQAFMALFQEKFDIHYTTEPGAAHTWDFWDRQIQQVLNWLPLGEQEDVW